MLFARPVAFLMGAAEIDGLPAADLPEVAFAGRSNVGKSSLINALVGQKHLARASNEPGRTREVNFFVLDGAPAAGRPARLRLRPGVEDATTSQFQNLGRAYLRGRPNLKRVYLLIDARHGLKAADAEALDALDLAAVSYQIVLTKADKLKAAEVAPPGGSDPQGRLQTPGRLSAGAGDFVGEGRRSAGAARRDHRGDDGLKPSRLMGKVDRVTTPSRLLYPKPPLFSRPGPAMTDPPIPKSQAGPPPRPWPRRCPISRSTTARRW